MQRTLNGGGPERRSRTRATRCQNEAAPSPAAKGLYPVDGSAITPREWTNPSLALALARPVLFALFVLSFAPHGASAQETREAPDALVYTYNDGERTLKVLLLEDLVLTRTKVAHPSEVLARVGDAVIVRLQPEEEAPNAVSAVSGAQVVKPADAQPVFLSESGRLMALPGGVIVLFDTAWDSSRAMRFFAAEGIPRSRISPLPLENGYLVETAPGFPSLDLANRFAGRPGVDASSPNWWSEVVP